MAEGKKWTLKAAEQGLADAQHSIGVSYMLGESIRQDYVLAHMWMNLAAAQGHPAAVSDRNALARNMTPAQIAEAQRLAREWKPKK